MFEMVHDFWCHTFTTKNGRIQFDWFSFQTLYFLAVASFSIICLLFYAFNFTTALIR